MPDSIFPKTSTAPSQPKTMLIKKEPREIKQQASVLRIQCNPEVLDFIRFHPNKLPASSSRVIWK